MPEATQARALWMPTVCNRCPRTVLWAERGNVYEDQYRWEGERVTSWSRKSYAPSRRRHLRQLSECIHDHFAVTTLLVCLPSLRCSL